MIDAPRVLITRVSDDVPLPSYAHPGDAGADLTANEAVELAPGERAAVPTGIAIALPDGFAAFVHPRSGLAARHGLSMVNAPGTVLFAPGNGARLGAVAAPAASRADSPPVPARPAASNQRRRSRYTEAGVISEVILWRWPRSG